MSLQLTAMQKRYIWIAGSNPTYIILQGRGKRSRKLLYAYDHEASELAVFGYGNPAEFLVRRGLFRVGQAPYSYVLTDEGERQFQALLLKGWGLNADIEEAEMKSRAA